MPIREKVRPGRIRSKVTATKNPTRRVSRGSPVVAESRRAALEHHRAEHHKQESHKVSGATTFAKAVRFLLTLSDYERLRIVRYNTDNFNLDRMRTLLKKLGNPHEQFKSVHVAGTK